MADNLMDKIVALAKRRGFIYPGSELYGGLANTYDYGPTGTELLRNIKNLWWKKFVVDRDDIVGIDASIISHHRVWEASGHTANFADALLDCKHCKNRIRADHLIEEWLEKNSPKINPEQTVKAINQEEMKKAIELKKVEGWSNEKMEEMIQTFKIKCPKCGSFDWTPVRRFNQLFDVQLGLIEGEEGSGYLRGETAQGMFINFKNVVESTRVRLPFGIAQQGKSFRNEITPGNFIHRTIEFEQGEIEYFFDPDKNFWEQLFDEWKSAIWKFVTLDLGIKEENLRWRIHTDEERSFYSKRTEDLEYKFPFGYKELWGLAYRTDYDLKQHMQYSGKDLSIADPYTGKKIIPHTIEPAVGMNRLLLMALCDAYSVDPSTASNAAAPSSNLANAGSGQSGRVVLKLNPLIAPYKVAVFPLLSNKEDLVKKAREIFESLHSEFVTVWDDRGNIGKRYLYQDEIGTPWCITVDFQSLEDKTVTIRDRDTTKQVRVAIIDLKRYFKDRLE
jgi:glycyl-tRNA synthetase